MVKLAQKIYTSNYGSNLGIPISLFRMRKRIGGLGARMKQEICILIPTCVDMKAKSSSVRRDGALFKN